MDRKPLLSSRTDEEDDCEELQWKDSVRLSCENPSACCHFKKGKAVARLLLFSIMIVVTLFLKSEYDESMATLEARECSDVLADCENVPFNDTVLPPYYDYLQDFTLSLRYDISQCLIPKVMSTISTATFCYLEDPTAFTKANRTISGERFCVDNERKSFSDVKKHLHRESARNIILVRDPFERFLSGFSEKCIKNLEFNYCHGCGTDVRCFLRKEFRRLKRISMLFPVYTRADTHFAPQTWFCDMKNTLQNSTLIRYGNTETERERMIEEFQSVFRRNAVAENEIAEFRKELSKGKSYHSTVGTESRNDFERLVREDKAIRRALIRFYYYDFVILGYKMDNLV